MKKILCSLICLFIILALSACQPKGKPDEVLNGYYGNVKDNNLESAYEKYAEATKKNLLKEDFITWQKCSRESSTLKDTKIEKINEYKDKDLDGTTYKNAIEFNVTETLQDLYENKEITNTYQRYVVNDNGSWKVYRGVENSKELIARAQNRLAQMYISGKGKLKDLNQAAAILNESLNYSKDVPSTYYSLGWTYGELGRYDESIDVINTFLQKATENKEKSDGYNLLGLSYKYKNNIDKSKECFKKALELNPNNQYAKSNLALLN